jgi:hypothetical protein
MRAAAVVLSLSLFGCFPHDAHKRTLAQYVEGGSIVAGIGVEFLVNTGADCDQMRMAGITNASCHTRAEVLGDIGVALILAGLMGFTATMATAEEEKAPARIDIKADKPAEKPDVKLPPGVKPSPTTAASGAATGTDGAAAHAAP